MKYQKKNVLIIKLRNVLLFLVKEMWIKQSCNASFIAYLRGIITAGEKRDQMVLSPCFIFYFNQQQNVLFDYN